MALLLPLLLALRLPTNAVDIPEENIPTFMWSQDEDTIFITIEEQCKDDTVDIAADRDFFGFSCVNVDGVKKTLGFTPREDIVASTAKCGAAPGIGERCTLKKVHRHYFDRLWALEDDVKLMKKAKVDWKAMNDVEVDDFEGYGTRYIKSLDEESLEKLVKKARKTKTALALDVSFPWCIKCKDARDMFETSAKKLHKKALFGYVDAREHRKLARKFEVDCTHKCTFHVLPPGELNYTEVEAPSGATSGSFVSSLETNLKPALQVVKTEKALKKIINKFDGAVVTSYDPEKDTEALKAISFAAKSHRLIPFVVLKGKALAKKKAPEGTEIWAQLPKRKKIIPFEATNGVTNEELLLFAKKVSVPEYQRYGFSFQEVLKQAEIPVAKFYIRKKEGKQEEKIIKKIAAEFYGRVATYLYDEEGHYMDMPNAGLPKDQFPALCIWDHIDDDDQRNKRYAYIPGVTEGDWSIESVRQFYEDYLGKNLMPTYKSQPVPDATYAEGEVFDVVHSTLYTEVVQNDEDVLLIMYKEWTPDKERHFKTASNLARLLKVSGVRVAKYDAYENYVDHDLFKITDQYWGTAKIYLFSDTVENRTPKLIAVSDGGDKDKGGAVDFTQGNVLKELKKLLPDVASSFDKIKEEVKVLRKEAVERAEKRKKEAEEAKKSAMEEKEKMDEILKTAEKIDVTPDEDKGVLKQIIKEGEKDTSPPEGMRVVAHYTGTLEDGTKFDSSRDRGDTFDFDIVKSQVIKCWDIAFSTMNIGERAMLTCEPEYAYGESGSPPKIPPDATLKFDVELISWRDAYATDGTKDEL